MRTFGLFIALLCLTLINADSPSLVVEIFRHGIRTPEATQYDQQWEDKNVGYGELTNFGMRQQYILGAALGETYPDLLIPYNPAKIYVQTTQENRTIVSALSQLFGIYETHGPNLPEGFNVTLAVPPYDPTQVNDVVEKLQGIDAAIPGNFWPIPVHNVQRSADILMESYLNCPNANQYFYSQQNDSTVEEVFALLNDTIKAVNDLNLTVEDYSDLDDLGDTVMADYPNQVELPGNISATSQIYKDLVFWTQWYEIYPVLNMQRQRQWFSGPFFYNLLGMFQQVQNASTALNFVFYAAKETMLATILSSLNIMTPECLRENWEAQKSGSKDIPNPQCKYPYFAANLIFEFYNTSDPYVIVKYDGDIMQVCNGQDKCSLTDFTALVQNVTNGTTLAAFNTNCGTKTTYVPPVDPNPNSNAPLNSTETNSSDMPTGAVNTPDNLPNGLSTLDYVLFGVIAFLAVSLIVVVLRGRKHAELNAEYYKNVDVEA